MAKEFQVELGYEQLILGLWLHNLITFIESFIIDVRLGSKYASDCSFYIRIEKITENAIVFG